MNIFGFGPKAGSKHVHVVNPKVASGNPKTVKLLIFMIKQAIEIKRLDYHLLCPRKCCMNVVLIDEVLKVLAFISSDTILAKQILNPCDVTCPIIISLKITGIINCTDGENQLEKSMIIKMTSR